MQLFRFDVNEMLEANLWVINDLRFRFFPLFALVFPQLTQAPLGPLLVLRGRKSVKVNDL